MKKLQTLSLAIFIAVSAQAQISITQAEMPHSGDQLSRVKAVTNPFINYGATGASYTWNFGNLAADGNDATNYQTVASTNFVYAIVYADLFFNDNRANHAKPGTDLPFSNLLPLTNPYTFRYRSNTSYRTVGFGAELSGIPLPIIFDEHDEIYKLPLNYGNTSSSHSRYHIDVPNVGYYGFEQDRTNNVDGWGVITTPGGVFEVLRVKTTLNMSDSIGGFAIDRPVVREYKWLAQGLRVPVLQVNTTSLFGTEVVTAIYYYDVPRTIQVVAPLANTICPGATLAVNYAITGSFNAGGLFVPANHFTAQLSDATGSFAAPVNIGDVTSTTSGAINATIPAGTPAGNGYRIRVISTSPGFTGASNAFPITIGGTTQAAISANGPSLICTGEVLTMTAVGGPSYQWQLDGAAIAGATSSTYDAALAGVYTVVVANACGSATSNTITVEMNTPPLQTLDVTEVLICAGQSAIISATDVSGQSPLGYQWYLNDAPIAGATEATLTATLGGLYTLTATNSATGCTSTTEGVLATIDAVATPEIIGGPLSFCAGASVELSAQAIGATGYQWYVDGAAIADATGEVLLVEAPGDYTVVSSNANGCSSAASQAVAIALLPVPDTQVVTVAGPTTFCAGGSVELGISATAQSIQWSVNGNAIPGAVDTVLSVVEGGNYTVVIMAPSGCSSAASDAITVVVDAQPEVPVLSSTEPTTFCFGGGSTLLAVADAGDYAWFLDGTMIPGTNSLQLSVYEEGAYTMSVTTANGCSATSAATMVVVNPLPTTPVITMSYDSLVTTGTGMFQWYLNGSAISGATNAWWVPANDGTYTVRFTDANGCMNTSEGFVYLTTSISPLSTSSLQVMPNPSNGSFTIQMPDARGRTFEILDATGKRVLTGKLTDTRTAVDLGQAQSGVYFLRVLQSGNTPVMRIVIAH